MSVKQLKVAIASRGYKLPEKFTVKRSVWLRGRTKPWYSPVDSTLLNKDGKMCCMGQLLSAAGASEAAILNDDSVETFVGAPDLVGTLGAIYDANDKHGVKRSTREKRVKLLVKDMLGIDVTFVD